MPEAIINTPRLKLRLWKDEDSEPFIKLSMDEEVMHFFPAILSPGETLAQIARIKQQFADSGYGLYAIERKDNGLFIGFTGFAHPRFESFFTPCVEIGWRLSKENWGQGFATEAAIACIQHGFSNLGFKEILSWTAEINKPSIQVMKKAGMQQAGYFKHPLIPEGHILRPHIIYRIAGNNVPV